MKKKLIHKYFHLLFNFKKYLYKKILSNINPKGKYILSQPILFLGNGNILIGDNSELGYFPSPYFYSGYMHIEARSSDSIIEIGAKTHINNNACIISDGSKIAIGSNCLIGYNFHAYDTDFHGINPKKRDQPSPAQPVTIGDNVFIGSNVMIMKGVSIGNNCTIAAGSIVTKSFPDNVIIAGNPAKIIKEVGNELTIS
ncbi:MAG: DapH/DapD/GlmU-related protein [bacterium]